MYNRTNAFLRDTFAGNPDALVLLNVDVNDDFLVSTPVNNVAEIDELMKGALVELVEKLKATPTNEIQEITLHRAENVANNINDTLVLVRREKGTSDAQWDEVVANTINRYKSTGILYGASSNADVIFYPLTGIETLIQLCNVFPLEAVIKLDNLDADYKESVFEIYKKAE